MVGEFVLVCSLPMTNKDSEMQTPRCCKLDMLASTRHGRRTSVGISARCTTSAATRACGLLCTSVGGLVDPGGSRKTNQDEKRWKNMKKHKINKQKHDKTCTCDGECPAGACFRVKNTPVVNFWTSGTKLRGWHRGLLRSRSTPRKVGAKALHQRNFAAGGRWFTWFTFINTHDERMTKGWAVSGSVATL